MPGKLETVGSPLRPKEWWPEQRQVYQDHLGIHRNRPSRLNPMKVTTLFVWIDIAKTTWRSLVWTLLIYGCWPCFCVWPFLNSARWFWSSDNSCRVCSGLLCSRTLECVAQCSSNHCLLTFWHTSRGPSKERDLLFATLQKLIEIL